jgi:hypothetical protein
LSLFEPGDCGSKLHDLTGKFMAGSKGESWPEFTLVDVKIGPANAACVDLEKDFTGFYFGNRNITVFEFPRSVVNNGFHEQVKGWGKAVSMFVVKSN